MNSRFETAAIVTAVLGMALVIAATFVAIIVDAETWTFAGKLAACGGVLVGLGVAIGYTIMELS